MDDIGLDAVSLQVGEDERLRVGASRERDACLLAHGAVCAVTPDHVSGADPLVSPVAVPQTDTRRNGWSEPVR